MKGLSAVNRLVPGLMFPVLSMFATLLCSGALFAGVSDEDREAVEMAALDYVDGFYLSQPERIERSVSRNLSKTGFVATENGYREVPRTYDRLYRESGRYNADGHIDPETAPRKIEILDILDQIAVVKLSAEWGIDYLNLAREDGRWKVIKVVWQTYPDSVEE